ncbi:hypothetical protein BHM03_00024345, partial [Ensete ventricosum]
TADIDEKSIRRANPDELVMVLAEAKADAIISRIKSEGYVERIDAPTLLITSDIVCYSGGHVSTVGSVLVTNLKTGRRYGGLDKAEVYFHDIPDEIIENLIDEGVVFNVAGGLLLEHPLTLPFVEAVVSSRVNPSIPWLLFRCGTQVFWWLCRLEPRIVSWDSQRLSQKSLSVKHFCQIPNQL